MIPKEQTTITPEQEAVLDPLLHGLKDAFFAVQESEQDFRSAGQQHKLNLACALSFYRQMRDDASASLEYANVQIGKIAYSLGTTREELEARERLVKRNLAVIEQIDDPTDAAIASKLLFGN